MPALRCEVKRLTVPCFTVQSGLITKHIRASFNYDIKIDIIFSRLQITALPYIIHGVHIKHDVQTHINYRPAKVCVIPTVRLLTRNTVHMPDLHVISALGRRSRHPSHDKVDVHIGTAFTVPSFKRSRQRAIYCHGDVHVISALGNV